MIDCFDRSKLLVPSFIEKTGPPQHEENLAKRSQSKNSEGATIKLKARIGSANMTNVLKEKLAVKR